MNLTRKFHSRLISVWPETAGIKSLSFSSSSSSSPSIFQGVARTRTRARRNSRTRVSGQTLISTGLQPGEQRQNERQAASAAFARCQKPLNPNSEVESCGAKGARPSGRFNVHHACDSRTPNMWVLKRRERRAPAVKHRSRAFYISEFGLKRLPASSPAFTDGIPLAFSFRIPEQHQA